MVVVETIYHNHLLPPQQWELDLAAKGDLTLSMLRFAIAFFTSIPVAIIFRRIPTPKARYIYALITGIILIYYPFGNGCLHALITSSVTYFFMLRFRSHCGTLTWVVIFPYLVANHIAQASGMAWKEGQLDFTGAQMVLTLKLVAVAICYQDGARDNDALLRDYARSKQLTKLPSPLEFFSYLFAAGNLLSGPFFEAKDYFDYVERKGDWDETGIVVTSDDDKNGNGNTTTTTTTTIRSQRIPSAFVPGTYRFLKALMCAAVWMYFTRQGITVDLLESTTWQETYPLPIRIGLMWAAVVIYRFKYYFVWGVSEAALIFSGLGFKQHSAEGKPLWNRYINSHIRGVELNPSLADTPRHWNICTGLWLRHYVYERLTPPHRKPSFLNMVVTQLVSGVWHGVFAGYWLFFATSAFMFQASRLLYRYEQSWSVRVRNFFPWTVVKIVASELVLDYAGSAFMVLSLKSSWTVWRSVYFFGHVLMFTVLLVGWVMPPKRRTAQKTEPEHVVVSAGGGVEIMTGKEIDASEMNGDGEGGVTAVAVAATEEDEKKEN